MLVNMFVILLSMNASQNVIIKHNACVIAGYNTTNAQLIVRAMKNVLMVAPIHMQAIRVKLGFVKVRYTTKYVLNNGKETEKLVLMTKNMIVNRTIAVGCHMMIKKYPGVIIPNMN